LGKSLIGCLAPLTIGVGSLGFTYVKMKLVNAEKPSLSEVLELVVDTGAVYTIISKGVLEKLQIERREKRVFQTVNKQKIERDIGVAVVEYMDRVAGTIVIFGEDEDTPLLGVTTLEELGLEVDPVSKQLKPMTLLLL